MVSFQLIVESIQRLHTSKWHWDVNHFAACLDITTEEANGFIKAVSNGGSGSKKQGTWQSNPAPYSSKINLSSNNENLLNLHVTDKGNKAVECPVFTQPSHSIIELGKIFVRVGKVSGQRKEITVSVQRDIAKYIIGTHKTLKQFYPGVASFRQKVWRSWIDGGEWRIRRSLSIPSHARHCHLLLECLGRSSW